MLTLKNNQKVDILKSGDNWFTCISDEKGLISYSQNPFLSQSKEGTSINMKTFLSYYDEIKKFNIEEKIKNIRRIEDYSSFVDKFMHLQNVMFEMSAFESFVSKSSLPEDHKKGILAMSNGAKSLLEAYEDVFKDVAKAVPANWAYAMFPESSWTGYPFLVEKHRLASGNTTRFTENYGRTLSDAKEADRNAREFREALKQDIHKEEKIFLDLQKQIQNRQHISQYNHWMNEVLPYTEFVKPHLQDYIDAKYNGNIELKPQHLFEIEQEKITELIAMFINDTITNPDLKQKYLDNLYNRNPNMILTLKTDAPKPNMTEEEQKSWNNSATGRIQPEDVNGVDIKKTDIGKVHVEVRLGIQKPNGKIETNINNIITYMHEIAHSISERNLSVKPMDVKEDCVGEIEAMFMENLFMHYLSKNATQLTDMFFKEGIIPSADPKYIKNIIENYRAEHDKGLQDKIEMIQTEKFNPDNPRHKQYEFRYLVGDIYCYVLNDMYKADPAATIEQYAKFLESNASLSLDDSSKILFDNDTITKQDIIKKFTSKLDDKTQKLLAQQDEKTL